MDSSRLLVLLGLSFASVTGAAFIYLLLRKDEETDGDFGITTSRRTVIKVKVPNHLIGTIIGRGGCTIRAIQDKTGARLNCNDQSPNDAIRIITIQGSPDSAQLAESMIHELIVNQPLIISHEMWVPSKACGRIIGKGGETIRNLSRTSCAKIMVDSCSGQGERATETRVLLKGTAEQIDIAKALIEEKVEEEADFHRRLDITLANRSPRREPNANLNYLLAPSSEEVDSVISAPKTEKLAAAGSESFFEVFVSASANPGRFWVQVISSKGTQLDILVDKMTEYYSDNQKQQLHVLHEVSIGQIVAAPFDHDDKWYRAEVLEVQENEYDLSETDVTLYYVDFGDKCVIKHKNLFDLRTDFLSLYFQAIECQLANVKPIDAEWSDEACVLFDELAAVAMWGKRLAHVITYKDCAEKRGHRAGSPVPVIELCDMDKKINIGEELVSKGLAVWEKPTQDENKSGSASANLPNPNQSSQPKGRAATSSSKYDSPSASLRLNDSASASKKKLESDSSSFISKEKEVRGAGGFRPKTLGDAVTQNKEPKVIINVPEIFSSDEDSDGFVLG